MVIKYYPPHLCGNESEFTNKSCMTPPTKTEILRESWLEPSEIINTSNKHYPTNNLDAIKTITNPMMILIGCMVLIALIIFCPVKYIIGILCTLGILYKSIKI